MLKTLFVFIMAASAALAQYKVESAGSPPSGLPPAITGALQKDGAKVIAANGSPVCELWFLSAAPSGPKNSEEGVTLPTIPQGALLGILRFPGKGSDRRGQNIAPGVYTLRYSLQPVNGDHQGVAPQRDFLVLVPLADDKDAKAIANIDDLMKMSRKASGTPHPAVLSIYAGSGGGKVPELKKEGDSDWVLQVKIGELPVSVIVVGKVEG